jgi:fumarate reductase subunit C
MGRWWRRDPFFVRYMWREATALAVALYALLLLAGVVCLSAGEATWNGWLAVLRSPWSVLLHLVLLAAFAYHAYSWFEIMPKTLAMMFVGGRRVADETITRAGWAAAVLASLALLALAVWGAA